MLTNLGNRGIEPFQHWKVALLFYVGFALILLAAAFETSHAVEVEGFSEPNRTINVAAAETGIITRIDVEEGDYVEAEQVIAQLDDEVHQALLSVAQQSMEAKGRLDAAMAEYKLRQYRLEKFEELRASGHARQEEVDRARTEFAVSEGQLTAAQEDALIKRLEYEKTKTQLERRSIRSPISGVVTKLHKQMGEFVAPNNPEVLTLVELDPLLAVFSVMRPQAGLLQVDQKVTIRFSETNYAVEGTVQFIAPITDAESGTVRVKVRIDNPEGQYHSGDRCVITLPDKSREQI